MSTDQHASSVSSSAPRRAAAALAMLGAAFALVAGYGERRFVAFVSSAAGVAGNTNANRQVFHRRGAVVVVGGVRG